MSATGESRMGALERMREALAGRYLIEREIGRGGMAVVYLAQDLRHDRRVALKVLLPNAGGSPELERFKREIHFAARLQHPHILTVLDSGEVGPDRDGQTELWYTMPFVDGESLRYRLNRDHQLSVDDALRITTEAARALEYAHQEGVIHRDIKPENILLTRDGTTLVADFGIARTLGAEEGLTRTGRIIGTPMYMSPEQLDDREVDARSDQYALAAVLYEMLGGMPPFLGRTVHSIAAARLSDPQPSVRALRPEVPESVDEAIRRAMSPTPADRFPTTGAFAQALAGSPSGAWIPIPRASVASRTSTTGATGVPPGPAGLTSPGAGEAGRAAEPPLPAAVARGRNARAMALTAAVLAALGALFAWRRMAERAPPSSGGRVVAVLPFENLGDSADMYFADGVADEVRTKLAQVSGLEVIARGSSLEYRKSTMRPTDIARELGADYLLTGTVRWEKYPGGSRVRVTPELVDARADRAARTRWAQQFDASLTDVFQVQADIATKVAAALGVALADSTRRELTAKPTESLAAYDEFLRGEAAAGMMKADQASLRRAIGFYEHAVTLDPTFVPAWSQLSRARSSLYSNGIPDPALGQAARLAAEQAQKLRPNDPSVYLALGDYYGSVNPIDNAKAAEEYEKGLEKAPDNVDLLGAVAVRDAIRGRWDGVAARVARATQLDPRSANTARQLAVVQTFLRNYPAADSAADRAVALAPNNPTVVLVKVLVTLGRGDLDSARAVIRAAEPLIGREALLAFFASYQDLYWVLLRPQQEQVLRMAPKAFDDDRATWGLVRAEVYHLLGDRPRSLVYADSARIALEEQTRKAPDDGQRRVLLGLALAYLGRTADAMHDGERGVQLWPISQDAYFGPYVQLQLVRIYLLVGEPEKALDQLEPLLRIPFYLSPGWLRIDPTFDPLRSNPRFQKLVAGAAGR